MQPPPPHTHTEKPCWKLARRNKHEGDDDDDDDDNNEEEDGGGSGDGGGNDDTSASGYGFHRTAGKLHLLRTGAHNTDRTTAPARDWYRVYIGFGSYRSTWQLPGKKG